MYCRFTTQLLCRGCWGVGNHWLTVVKSTAEQNGRASGVGTKYPFWGILMVKANSYCRRILSIALPLANSSTSLSMYRACRVSGFSISSTR